MLNLICNDSSTFISYIRYVKAKEHLHRSTYFTHRATCSNFDWLEDGWSLKYFISIHAHTWTRWFWNLSLVHTNAQEVKIKSKDRKLHAFRPVERNLLLIPGNPRSSVIIPRGRRTFPRKVEIEEGEKRLVLGVATCKSWSSPSLSLCPFEYHVQNHRKSERERERERQRRRKIILLLGMQSSRLWGTEIAGLEECLGGLVARFQKTNVPLEVDEKSGGVLRSRRYSVSAGCNIESPTNNASRQGVPSRDKGKDTTSFCFQQKAWSWLLRLCS